MNSDEDASFPFICEGSSAVLGIFGESAAVLPDMSTSSEVTDLEDVFSKDSSSANTQQLIAKDSVTDALSEFQVASTDLTVKGESKKDLQVNPPVLSATVDLTTAEIQQVLIQEASSSLAVESSVLDSVVETEKNLQETTSGNVAGSVELAEEIMEAFANSKAVLDSENPGTSNLQEELERLEQLAVERVREIEGDLVNSSRQITDSISNNVEINSDLQETFAVECVVPASEIISSDVMHVPDKEANENKECSDAAGSAIVATTSEVVVADCNVKSVSTADEKEGKKNISLLKEETLIQDDIPDLLKRGESSATIQKHLSFDGGTDNTATETKTKEDTQSEVSEEISNRKNISETETAKADKCIIKNNNSKDVVDSEITEVKQHKSGTPSLKKDIIDDTTFDNGSLKMRVEIGVPTAETDAASVVKDDTNNKNKNTGALTTETEIANFVEDTTNKNLIKDLQDYETEDDDLSVLEAFIEKSATNPELAVCSMPEKRSSLRDSLESSLIDVLSKTDNGGTNGDKDAESNKVSNSSAPKLSVSGSESHQDRPSKTSENASREETSDSNSKPKIKEGLIEQQKGTKGKNAESIDMQLPLKKRISQMPLATEKQHSRKTVILVKQGLPSSKGSERVVGVSMQGSVVKVSEKKIVTVEVKNRKGRPPTIFRKSSIEKSSVDLKSKNDVENTLADKSVLTTTTDREKIRKSSDDKSSEDLNREKTRKSSDDKSSEDLKNKEVEKPHATKTDSTLKSAEKPGASKESVENSDSCEVISEKPSVSKKAAAEESNHSKATDKEKIRTPEPETPSKKSMKIVPKKRKENRENGSSSETAHAKMTEEQPSQCSGNAKGQKKCADEVTRSVASSSKTPLKNKEDKLKEIPSSSGTVNVTAKESTSKTLMKSKERKLEKVSPSAVTDEKRKHKEGVEKLPSSKGKKSIVEKSPHSTPVQETVKDRNVQDNDLHIDAVKIDKKEEKIVENTPVKKIVDIGDNDSTEIAASSRSTRSMKRKGSTRRLESPKHTGQKTGKDKENLEESSRTVSNNRDPKRKDTETVQNSTHVSTKSTKNKELCESAIQKAKSMKRTVEESLSVTLPTPKRIRTETEVEVLSVFEKEKEVHGNSVVATKCNAQRIDSGAFSFEDEDITFDVLKAKAKQLILPSPLWGVQISETKDLVAFSRLCLEQSGDLLIDKALVFQGSLKPIALIKNEPVDIPIPSIRTFEDVVDLISNFHFVSFCEGTGVKQRPVSRYCYKYLDVANPGQRCTQCLEERRRLLVIHSRKLTERLRLMREEINQQ